MGAGLAEGTGFRFASGAGFGWDFDALDVPLEVRLPAAGAGDGIGNGTPVGAPPAQPVPAIMSAASQVGIERRQPNGNRKRPPVKDAEQDRRRAPGPQV